MERVVGRAGFHATHCKPLGQRRAVLDEMMRSLSSERSEFWASVNPSLVLADEALNAELVNDGKGGLVPCKSIDQVLSYGQSRVERLDRKLRADKPDKNGKMSGGTMTTTMIVSHLPRSLCREVPDFYPRRHKDGSPMIDPATGKPLSRSRWVARDRDEAISYFTAVVSYLADHVVPGGREAILGASIQFSESTPHIQILADTFAPHPTKEGKLRVDTSRAWFTHRDVRDEHGKMIQGPDKLRAYHAGMKEFLIGLGYDVSPDYDEDRHMLGFAKADYEETQDMLHLAGVELEAAERVREDVDRRAKNYELVADEKVRAKHADERAVLDREFGQLASRERALEDEWKGPDEDGRGEGPKHRRAREHAEQHGRAKVDKVLREVEAERDRLKAKPAPLPVQFSLDGFMGDNAEFAWAQYLASQPKVRASFERFLEQMANASQQAKNNAAHEQRQREYDRAMENARRSASQLDDGGLSL